MSRIKIPNTNLDIFPVALGVAMIGVKGSEAEGKALLDRFVERSGNLIDTARVYSDWVPGERHRSERILGDWLAERKIRDRVLVATKGGHPYPLGSRISRLSSRELEEDLNGSLKSLRIETIDLYWLHRDDPALPVGPIMDCLHLFQTEGKIKFYAASNWTPERIREANAYAKEHGYIGFVASQVEWNLGVFHRLAGPDSTMLGFSSGFLRLHGETGLAAIPYASQAGGYFGKRSLNPELVKGNPYDTPVNRKLHACLVSAQAATGLSMNQMVLAYLFSHRFPVVPLVGCRTQEQLVDSMGAAGCRLPESVLAEINDILNLAD
jgi:aryl-alcohol dehydrogenase-like predicted oxidoreductase